MIHPDTTQLAPQLANVAARNAASTIATKITASKARKHDKETINDLVEIVNDLINDRGELISIAQAYEEELVAQRMSESDITYITTRFLPVMEQLADLSEDDDNSTARAIEAVKSLVSVEALTIMQLVGFNFRRAIGEPLTALVERLILSRVATPEQSVELQVLQTRRDAAIFEAVRDPEARQTLQALNIVMGGPGAAAAE